MSLQSVSHALIFGLSVTLVSLLSSCTSVIFKPEEPLPITQPVRIPYTAGSGNREFDNTVRDAMKGNAPLIKVPASSPFIRDQLEHSTQYEHLRNWTVAVQLSGGRVTEAPIKSEMGANVALIALITLSMDAIEMYKEWKSEQEREERKRLAGNYHVRFCYREDTGEITKALFFKRWGKEPQC